MAATEDLYQAWYRLYGVCACRRADARLVLLIHAGGRFVLDLGVEVTSDVGMTLIRCVAFESALSFSLSAGPLLSLSSDKLSSPTADGLASRVKGHGETRPFTRADHLHSPRRLDREESRPGSQKPRHKQREGMKGGEKW